MMVESKIKRDGHKCDTTRFASAMFKIEERSSTVESNGKIQVELHRGAKYPHRLNLYVVWQIRALWLLIVDYASAMINRRFMMSLSRNLRPLH